jgi:hypothetical protein
LREVGGLVTNQAPLGVALMLVAACLPLLASVVVALFPRAAAKDIDDYFVFERRLDIDSFLKTSVGYSLQVAAIFLFFYWTFQFGIRTLIVAFAWGAGYKLLGVAVSKGYLDRFLSLGARQSDPTVTIHGFVGARTGLGVERSRLLVFVLGISTVAGLGGTTMVEVDYATKYLLSGIGAPSTHLVETVVHLMILSFTVLYVLWGGYRAVVYTDRIQVPFAYFAFGLLLLGLAFLFPGSDAARSALIVIVGMLLYIFVLLSRRKLLGSTDPDFRRATWLFGGLIFLSLYTLFWLWPSSLHTVKLAEWLLPDVSQFWGFGALGCVSLLGANALWQFVDISSMQRLQSLQLAELSSSPTSEEELQKLQRRRIASGLSATGFEAGTGWVLIILAALMLKALGVSDASAVPAFLLAHPSGLGVMLAPILMFTIAVFMLSTISALISAISYVAYFDLNLSAYPHRNSISHLSGPRFVTLVAVGLIYMSYLALRAKVPDSVAASLYAIYALQASIAPSVFVALRGRNKVSVPAALLSVLVGWVVSVATAVGDRWEAVSQQSWEVLPPFAAVFSATLSYWITAKLLSWWGRK